MTADDPGKTRNIELRIDVEADTDSASSIFRVKRRPITSVSSKRRVCWSISKTSAEATASSEFSRRRPGTTW